MFISPAYAAPAQAAESSLLLQLAPMAVIFVLFYFMLIRPQQKRMKEQKAMIDAIGKGDELVTNGGILGRVVKAGEQHLTIEIADGVEIVIQRGAVAAKLEKGTIKAQR
ncbi:preprotein translocase subunit YajC [Chitinimonas viridis]|uniref:Sec translocon accessory complex subunit YajC n=2 Tax=Chitinimonas TaxID=240411 RepID=A0ABT8B418_9NEIS|nr:MULTISPECIES: preprotein translocase subunit YajC [Chitinimonas]MBL8507311.1 preprotein translocase subunit YajC [Chitinimonas sp.]MDN3576565.1 preprotein translocase subunit YajC [Chitinimonas viridis]GLR11502.1 preprotein translocase subunit YajC [Chitinimonas prasina]